jgi:hypothetical protein
MPQAKQNFKAKTPKQGLVLGAAVIIIVAGEHRVCRPWRTGSELIPCRRRR